MTYNNIVIRKFHLTVTNRQRKFDSFISWVGLIPTSYRNTESPTLVNRIKAYWTEAIHMALEISTEQETKFPKIKPYLKWNRSIPSKPLMSYHLPKKEKDPREKGLGANKENTAMWLYCSDRQNKQSWMAARLDPSLPRVQRSVIAHQRAKAVSPPGWQKESSGLPGKDTNS